MDPLTIGLLGAAGYGFYKWYKVRHVSLPKFVDTKSVQTANQDETKRYLENAVETGQRNPLSAGPTNTDTTTLEGMKSGFTADGGQGGLNSDNLYGGPPAADQSGNMGGADQLGTTAKGTGATVNTQLATGDTFFTWIQWMTDQGFLERDDSNRLWIKHYGEQSTKLLGLIDAPNMPLDTQLLFAMYLGMTDATNTDLWAGKPGWMGQLVKKIPILNTLIQGGGPWINDEGLPYHYYKKTILNRWQPIAMHEPLPAGQISPFGAKLA